MYLLPALLCYCSYHWNWCFCPIYIYIYIYMEQKHQSQCVCVCVCVYIYIYIYIYIYTLHKECDIKSNILYSVTLRGKEVTLSDILFSCELLNGSPNLEDYVP